MAKRGISVRVPVNPAADVDVFRIDTADDVLRLIVDAHDSEFTVPELVEATGSSRPAVWRAVDLLDDLDLVQIRETAQRNYVSIDPTALEKDDPILAIEQPEFHEPVRTFLNDVQAAIDTNDDVDRLVGIVLFGSVARGEADRQSDIDVFVVVEGDRTAARRCVGDVVSDLGERRFDGHRYEFEQYVESVASTRRASEKLRELFGDGITLFDTDDFRELRREVLSDE